MVTLLALSRSSQCSMTGITKAVVCVCVLDVAYKRTLAVSPCSDGLEWTATICMMSYNS